MRVSVPARVRHSVALPAGGYTCAHCRRKVSFDDGTRRIQLIVTQQHQRDQLKRSARPLQEHGPNISEPTSKRRRVERSDGATRKRVDAEITVRNRAEIAVTTASKLDCPRSRFAVHEAPSKVSCADPGHLYHLEGKG